MIGSDPVLPTPLPIGEAGAATIAASGLMAARLWAQRGGRAQTVSVAVDAAAVAMRSARYARVMPETESANHATGSAGGNATTSPEQFVGFRPRAALGGTGVYRTRDARWVYLHRAFAHHRARICSVLDCADDEASLSAATATWDGLALEEAVVEAGACAALVRTAAEWQAHDQSRAIASLPLLEIERIGDASPVPLSTSAARPLAGVRV